MARAVASRHPSSSGTFTSTRPAGAIVALEGARAAPSQHAGPCQACSVRVQARRADAPGPALTLRPRVEDALPAVDRCLRRAERILGSWDLAWDAVQEALVALWQEAAAPRDPEGWLVNATVHRALHARRTRGRRSEHEERGGADRARAGEDPRRAVEVRDEVRAVEAAIDGLPEEFRAPLRLRELQGLEYDAIARTLEVPVGTVRSRLHRARERLQADVRPA